MRVYVACAPRRRAVARTQEEAAELFRREFHAEPVRYMTGSLRYDAYGSCGYWYDPEPSQYTQDYVYWGNWEERAAIERLACDEAKAELARREAQRPPDAPQIDTVPVDEDGNLVSADDD